jgi:hypothetical protein
MVVFVASSAIHILELSFLLIILQENIDTVTVEKVENVGEEDCIKIKTEKDCIEELVRRVKSEQEVSVVCWCVL